MKRALFFWILIIGICFSPLPAKAQLPSYTGPNSKLLYYVGAFAGGDTIFNYDPSLPVSSTNPSSNSIHLPGGAFDALAVSNNLNAASPSLTFYTIKGSSSGDYYYYYNGTGWTNTGHTTCGAPLASLGGGGGYLYNIAGGNVYRYDGTANDTLILSLPNINTNYIQDIVADCNGNFYIVNEVNGGWMRKYNPSGVLLNTWTISGIPASTSTSACLAIIGNNVYCTGSNTYVLLDGVVNGSNINFANTNIYLSPQAGDYGSVPLGFNVAVANTDTAYYNCGGPADTLIASGVSPFTWSVLSGPASISGSGDTVTVTSSGTAQIVLSSGAFTYCGSNKDTVTIIAVPPAIAGMSSNSPVCSGDSLQLAVSNWQAGISYSWSGPIGFNDTGHQAARSNMSFADSGYYSVIASIAGCSSSDSVFVSVKPLPNIPIAGSNSPVCAGDTLKFTVGNLQSGVLYYWTGPGFSVNAQNPIRPNAQSSYAGLYSAIASLNGCTRFGTTTVTINPILGPPTLSISASPDTICAGGTVTLSAVAGNAGSGPAYLWRRNGTVIPGANSPVFTTSNIANADHIVCKVTSNAACQHIDTALSNTLTMHVILVPPPTVTVSSYPASYISGDTVTFTGHLPANTNGYTYQWRKNGIDIPGATFSIYTSSNVHMGDSICLVVHSSVPCTIPDTAIACIGLTERVGSWQSSISNWQVYPNPFCESLTLRQAQYSNGDGIMRIKIYDIVGREVYTSSPLERPGEASINTHDFSKGTYILELIASDGSREIRKIVK